MYCTALFFSSKFLTCIVWFAWSLCAMEGWVVNCDCYLWFLDLQNLSCAFRQIRLGCFWVLQRDCQWLRNQNLDSEFWKSLVMLDSFYPKFKQTFETFFKLLPTVEPLIGGSLIFIMELWVGIWNLEVFRAIWEQTLISPLNCTISIHWFWDLAIHMNTRCLGLISV